MALVAVKKKYQVVIPQKVRETIGLSVGDLLDAKVERGKITFTPKSVVGRAIAEGLEDIKKGRVHGPFETVDEMLASLKGASAKRGKKPSHGR